MKIQKKILHKIKKTNQAFPPQLDPSSSKKEMVVRVTQERACRGVRARRTAAVEVADDGSAFVSECFHFRLRADELHTTSVTVQALQPHSVYAKGEDIIWFYLVIPVSYYR